MTPHKKIQLLPPSLQNQIAAGEVVERPASVLKELVENSLDAGAAEISITLEDGGQTLLAVHDNGFGIPATELDLALTRHATSKVTRFEDLLHVTSYGFRGEALPSIASVAAVRIESAFSPGFAATGKREDAGETEPGAFLEVTFGETGRSGPASIHQGTRITVRDLFANVPARLKFLKTPATELKRCHEALIRLALVRPQCAFSVKSGNRESLRLPANMDLRARLQHIWPPQIAENMVAFCGERHGMGAHGLASLPQFAQAKGDRILLYVNNRPVNDKLLLRAVREAYKGRLTSREFPQLVLFLEMPPELVDVNAHPAKTEVRFREERAVFSTVLHALNDALARHLGFAPMIAEEAPEDSAEYRACRSPLPPLYRADNTLGSDPFTDAPVEDPSLRESRAPRPAGFWGRLDTPRTVEKPFPQPHDPTEILPVSGAFRSFAFPGGGIRSGAVRQNRERYDASEPADTAGTQLPEWGREPAYSASEQDLLMEGLVPHTMPDDFFLTQAGFTPASPLSGVAVVRNGFPVVAGPLVCLGQVERTYLIVLDGEELLLLDQHAAHERVLLENIQKHGYEGHSQLLALPEEMALHPAEGDRLNERKRDLARLGYTLEQGENALLVRGVPSLLSTAQAIQVLRDILADRMDDMDDMFHFMACRAAIKAGQVLTGDEAAGLLRQWMQTPNCSFCPHGRPIVLRLERNVLEKLFKRRVP